MGALAIDEEVIRYVLPSLLSSLLSSSPFALTHHSPLPPSLPPSHICSARLEAQERALLRNHLRPHYDFPLLDKIAGEVTFDGHRWHVWVGIVSLIMNAFLMLSWYLTSMAEAAKRKKEKGKGGGKKD